MGSVELSSVSRFACRSVELAASDMPAAAMAMVSASVTATSLPGVVPRKLRRRRARRAGPINHA